MNIEVKPLSLDEIVYGYFDNPKCDGPDKYKVSCPLTENHAHGDKKQSLDISMAPDGTILVNCFSGHCSAEDILAAVHLHFWKTDDGVSHVITEDNYNELCNAMKGKKRGSKKSKFKSNMPPAGEKKSPKKPVAEKEKPMVVYETVDSGINALYSYLEYKDRYEYPNGTVKIRFWDPSAKDGNGDKTFRQFFPVPGGYTTKHPNDYVPTLWIEGPYSKKDGRITIDDPSVVLTEGEKDAHTIYELFKVTAVSGEAGGGTWKEEYTEQLTGKTVYIISDYDATGSIYVEKACDALYGKAEKIIIIRLEELWSGIPDKGDITDMVNELGEEETIKVVGNAMNDTEQYKPQTVAEKYGFPLELNFEKYEVDNEGVSRIAFDDDGKPDYQPVCAHPIMPAQILRNVETGEERIGVWYRIAGYDREIPVAGSKLFSSQKIIELADYGVSVSSTTAKALVNYLRETIDGNRDVIPVQKSVSHMGWIEGNKFVPYNNDIVYDGDIAFQTAVDSIHTAGDAGVWKKEVGVCREYSKEVRLVTAAAFASPVIEPLGAMIFFTHLWGVTSGSGKTVVLMIGASIYGDPEIGGGYAVSLNATAVSMERRAVLLRNLPFFGDEAQALQIDSRGNRIFDPYKLSEGVSKDRSNVNRGLDRMNRWANVFITTGETPLLSETDPAGAQNRILEIECPPGQKLIKDGFTTANILRNNYGYAGKEWIQYLQKPGVIDSIRQRVTDISRVLVSEYGITDKQAQAGALIITADELTTDLFWPEQTPLGIDDILPYLKSEDTVDTGARAYDFICSWITQNSHKFVNEKGLTDTEMGPRKVETYGVIRQVNADGIQYADIIKKVWDSACGEGGFNGKALLTWLKSKGLIVTEKETEKRKVLTSKQWIDGRTQTVVRMALPRERGCIEVKPYSNANSDPDPDLCDKMINLSGFL